jgi:general secretion pathway protein G
MRLVRFVRKDIMDIVQSSQHTFFEDSEMSKKRKNRRGQGGFTLIEILIVVIIIGLLASFVAPNLIGRYERSKEEIAKAQVEMLSSGVLSFKLDLDRYPTTMDELLKSTDPRWRGPYLSKQDLPKDPWGKDYLYKTPGDHGPFDLYSLGPDGVLNEKSAKNW